MIDHICAKPLERLGFVDGFHVPFMKSNQSLRDATNLPLHRADEEYPSSKLYTFSEGPHTFTFLYNGEKRTLKLGRVIFRSNGVIGRGTSVTEVECLCTNPNICPGGRCEWKNKNIVLKLSYPSATRASEKEFQERWTELADRPDTPHAWVLNHLPTIYYSFDIRFRDNSPQQNLKRRFGAAYEMRVLRGVIMEKLEPLTSLKTAKECAQVFYDVLQCHHWAWKYPQILHRDISQGNIMVRVKDGRKYGVLNDWDLASWVDDEEKGATSQYRTGTRPSMAHEQQAHEWEGPHQYRHDVESLFYVMVLFTFLYSKPSKGVSKPEDKQFHYEKWHLFNDEELHDKKLNIMAKGSWKPSVQPFFLHFSNWLIDVRVNFRRGFAKQADFIEAKETSRVLGETWPHEVQFYKDYSLGGHISYSKMARIMHVFNKEELVTYDDETLEYLESGEMDMEID
ncbi:hypothetical protein FB446DRAFT_676630 [Lentinula raphanica]|nr:hypothetical protein FB446DRAFT_676630 [Lentinula raphanica]